MIKIAKFSTGRTGMNAPTLSPAAPGSAPPANVLLSPELPASPSAFRQAITDAWLKDEAAHVTELLAQARLPADEQAQVQALAADLVARVRVRAKDQGAIEAFMRQYDLGSEEGVLLMCVAEALLRIPDQETADKLIRDKLADADWAAHLGHSESVFVNASTWALMLTGKSMRFEAPAAEQGQGEGGEQRGRGRGFGHGRKFDDIPARIGGHDRDEVAAAVRQVVPGGRAVAHTDPEILAKMLDSVDIIRTVDFPVREPEWLTSDPAPAVRGFG